MCHSAFQGKTKWRVTAVPFKAEIYRVLIASPSDLEEERQVATEAINEWNSQHAVAEGVVLLPVKWETHATPRSGVRPQEAINDELVRTSDILVGMFWAKIGTNTGIAESGTVEEIDEFVSAAKPAMLYFSRRPIDPNAINLKQQKKLRTFKSATYKNALAGGFTGLDDLRQTLSRDLLSQVRKMKPAPSATPTNKLDQALRLTELIVSHRKHKITPELFNKYREEFLKPRQRSKAQTIDPVAPGELGPNGYRVGYTKEGDKVEWLPDEEKPGKEWPMILRRNDKAILEAEGEFMDVIWYDRKLVLLQNLKEGAEPIDPKIKKGVFAAMRAVEKKYGKKKLRNYYRNDFEWGMLNGKLSALRWVMGDVWDMLDT
jgi:hypothetical protein